MTNATWIAGEREQLPNKALNRTWNSAVLIAAVPFWYQPFLARKIPVAPFHAG